MSNQHVLKIHPAPLADLLSGAKTAEVRCNDRGFQVGDTVALREVNPFNDVWTGRPYPVRTISHIQTGYGLPDGVCVLSYVQPFVPRNRKAGRLAIRAALPDVPGDMLDHGLFAALDAMGAQAEQQEARHNFNPADGSRDTAEQMAAVMLLHGSDEQKAHALEYAASSGFRSAPSQEAQGAQAVDEERQAALMEMFQVTYAGDIWEILGRLYDAGYRRAALATQPAAGEPVHQWADQDLWMDGDEAELASARAEGFKTRTLWTAPPAAAHGDTFQARVQPWMLECFGEAIAGDREERNHRFLEEALELVQSTGCTASEAHQLVDYVFGRPVGEPTQEVGGVMVTLAALCLANGLDMHDAAEVELARVWTKVEVIRAKQAAKPKHSPLPVTAVYGDEAVRKDATESAIQRACGVLPEGWSIQIDLERDAGCVTLFNPWSRAVDFGQDFRSIGAHVEAAIDAAMRAQAGEGGEV